MYSTKNKVPVGQSQWGKADKIGARIGPLYKGAERTKETQVPDPFVDSYRVHKTPGRFMGRQVSSGPHFNPLNARFRREPQSGPSGSKAASAKPVVKPSEVKELGPSNATGVEDGAFGRCEYWHEPYVTGTNYRTTQPMDKRKIGFGNGDAMKRDEFSDPIRTAQWRQQLLVEGKMASEGMRATLRKSGVDLDELRASGKDVAKELSASLGASSFGASRSMAGKTQYDRLRDHRDDPYNTKTLHSPTSKIQLGSHTLSSRAVGAGIEAVALGRPAHARVSVTKQFYRANGHN